MLRVINIVAVYPLKACRNGATGKPLNGEEREAAIFGLVWT